MEVCSHNLEKLIEDKKNCFGDHSSEPMNSIEFYISCQLFRELLKCVQYIHELRPPIIHRDLKPQNIIIVENPRKGKYLKLCDFGLAKEHENSLMSHTNGQGTFGYIAPEADGSYDKSLYNTKVDVYSLSKITMNLFDFDINL